MIAFIVRRLFLALLTLMLVSVAVFLLTEASPGNVARNILGSFVTPEQEASFLAQWGFDQPLYRRYLSWLIGSDWQGSRLVGLPLTRITTPEGFREWWAVPADGLPRRWKLVGEDLVVILRHPDGTVSEQVENGRWQVNQEGKSIFWGVDTQNRLVKWEKGADRKMWHFIMGTGWMEVAGGASQYLPLKKGFLWGDPGVSLRTGRPVENTLLIRLRNSAVLAGCTFVIVMPLALALGLIAGAREGSVTDRSLSISGMIFSVIPEFALGIFLILIFTFWLGILPGAAVIGENPPWERPAMLVLPVLTLAFIELGYVLRITRASMIEVMKSPYIRTAFLKGLPYHRVVLKHALRNALIAPITIIFLHINWLLSGIVVVEVVFGYPGLGKYLLDSALYKDTNALEAGAMIMVMVTVGSQLIADIVYVFLNPKIRYS